MTEGAKTQFAKTLKDELTRQLGKRVDIFILGSTLSTIGTVLFVGDDYVVINLGGVYSSPKIVPLAYIVSVLLTDHVGLT